MALHNIEIFLYRSQIYGTILNPNNWYLSIIAEDWGSLIQKKIKKTMPSDGMEPGHNTSRIT